ncbi:alanyl-tRNA synthetase [Staphylococcus phage DW2]|uniref:head scaffolding protein n=1 Tax=Staphylococcus phage DW2 TaxID=1464127 RepID=UPI00049A151A|nr:head scaffolding protein [Staphylococcus phage DW2]AHL18450.1 alanyl-tRNA synthetase [Staphylococcus phage DW2]
MNIEEVKSFFEEHKDDKEVKDYLNRLKTVSVDDVKGFLDTEEGKRFIQPELDRYHSKGLESWKEKNLENLIEQEVQKRNPEQSEEQKRISALEKELEKRDAEAKREKLRSNALGKAQELNLPTSLVDRFLGDSDEDTEQNLKALKETFDKYVQEGVESKFKSSGRDVKESQNQDLDSSNVKSIEEMAKEINIRK